MKRLACVLVLMLSNQIALADSGSERLLVNLHPATWEIDGTDLLLSLRITANDFKAQYEGNPANEPIIFLEYWDYWSILVPSDTEMNLRTGDKGYHLGIDRNRPKFSLGTHNKNYQELFDEIIKKVDHCNGPMNRRKMSCISQRSIFQRIRGGH